MPRTNAAVRDVRVVFATRCATTHKSPPIRRGGHAVRGRQGTEQTSLVRNPLYVAEQP
jgi:hypothetical protein